MTVIGKKDISLARYFDDNARCADLLNGYVFHGDQVIAAEDVQEVDSRVTGIEINPVENEIKYTQQFRDFVRKTIFGVGCVIVEIENQERIHYAMPIRVLSEEAKEYERQMKIIQKQHEMQKDLKKSDDFLGKFTKADYINGIVSLVIYYGKEPWDGPMDLYEMLDLEEIPNEMRHLMNHYPIHVLEVRRFKNTEWFQTDLREVFEVIQHAESKRSLKKFVESNEERLDNMARDACELIAVVTDTPEFAFRDKAYETGEGNVKMCQGMKEWLEEKYEEGHAEERVRSIANIMQNLNLSLEDACRGLGISVEEYNKAKTMIAR